MIFRDGGCGFPGDLVIVIWIAPYAAGPGCKIAATFGCEPVRPSSSRPLSPKQGERGSLLLGAELKNPRTFFAEKFNATNVACGHIRISITSPALWSRSACCHSLESISCANGGSKRKRLFGEG